MIQLDFNVVFLGGGGEEGGVFVVASAFESFILKLDMVTCIFHNVFVEDCSWQASGKEVQCLCCDIFFISFSFFCVYIQGDGTQDITEVMSDTDFIQNVLKNLPGVDPSSEAIQKVMVSLAQQDSDDGKGRGDQDEPMGEEDTDKDKKKDKE